MPKTTPGRKDSEEGMSVRIIQGDSHAPAAFFQPHLARKGREMFQLLDEFAVEFDEDDDLDKWSTVHTPSTDSPEKDLLRALLTEGVREYLKSGLEKEAAWLRGETGHFPYEYVCSVLGINCPDRLREAVFALRDQGARTLLPRSHRKARAA